MSLDRCSGNSPCGGSGGGGSSGGRREEGGGPRGLHTLTLSSSLGGRRDTSASMNQRTDLGTTYLDIAKGAVELFLKLRARDPASRGDRYMLVTYDEAPYCIKAGWKENHATFMSELKNLQASGLTTLGQALRSSFDLLNLNRLISGIDNYGQANLITHLKDHRRGKCKS
ncbi:integrator complex subunit 6-like [Eubalaena glacialis]|uniref:integrator complex subunit 6-like n=1 Tax=Eubalaena glacialis TaxID=27606 RepID=UPI002A5AFF99|nr:integrator complex subunit 6-like [Eubalaena glacialis]